MAFTPLFDSFTTKRPRQVRSSFQIQIIRDQLSLTTWLLIGAAVQSILFVLPIRPSYVALPSFLILSLKAIDTLLITYNLKANPYLQNTIGGKFTAILPNTDGTLGGAASNADTDNKKDDRVAILLLGFNSNHPLGLLAPGAAKINSYFDGMVKHLKANAATNGFLGHNAFLGDPQGRSTKSDIMVTFYFRSLADVQVFAHGPVHREGWNWWARTRAEHRHLSIMHEAYESPKGMFENVYENYRPIGIAATRFPVKGKEGEGWQGPVVGAVKGPLSNSAGRYKAYAAA